MAYLGNTYEELVKKKWFSAQGAKAQAELLAARRRTIAAGIQSEAAAMPIARIPAAMNGYGSGYEAEQEGGSDSDYELIAGIAINLDAVTKVVDLILELISQYGHDQGQYDMWMNLFVGAKIPPGYGGGEGGLVSYEMLTGQRDNWRLARDRSFTTLVESSNLLYGKIITLLLSMNQYLTESAHPDIELARSYRDRTDPLINAAETVGEIVKSNLQDIFAAYRKELQRLDLNLDTLGIDPIEIPKSVNWLVWGLVAVGAIILAQKVL